MAFGITATVTVAEMVAADLGFVFIDGGESAAVTAGKISFGIVKSEGTDAAKTWGIGPAMEGLELANAITDAPSAVNYNNVSYVFTQSGGILQYSTCSGSGWSASTTLVQSGLCLTDTPEPTKFTPEFGPSAVVFNDLLYVFYQGTPLGSTTTGLYYSVFNGTTWSDAIQVDNVGISCSPCAVVFNYQLYVFHQGGGNNGQLCYSVFNGASWAADKQVAGVGMSVSPAAAVYNGELYVLYQGSGNNGQLWYSTYNGNWSSSNNTDSSGGISAEPCAIVYDGELLVLHQGSGNSRNIYVNAFNGSSWVGDTQMAPIRISNSPAPVIFNDELYCFWQGPGSNGQLQYSGSDSSNWMPTTTLSGAQMSCSPSATEFNNQLYCMYQGSWQSGYLYQSVGTVQSTWSSPSTASPISLSASPSVVAVSDTLLYSFFQQEGQLCYTTCTSTNAWTSPYLVGWSSSATQLNTIGLMYTPSAVMFTPSGATSAQLYIFYQTADNTVSGQLWYVIFDTATGTCSPPIQVANVSLSYSPSAVVFNKQLYVFYQGGAGGQGNSGLYYDCLSTAGAWSGSQQVPGVGIAYSPAPVVYNNQLYVFHQGEGGGQPDNDLFYDCLSSAGTWSGDTQVSWVNLSYSPSAVFCGNQILVCYQGEANGQPDGCTYIASLTSSGGTSLEGYVDIVPATPPVMNGPVTAAAPITYAPAVAVCNDNLYILHQGGGASGQLWFNVMNSTSWSGATQVNPQVLSASPCAVNFGNVIYSFYNQGGQLWCNGNAGGAATWLPETQIPGVMLSGTPSAVVFNNEIYVFYQGASNNGQLCYVTYNPSTSSWASPVWINSAGEVLMENSPSAVVFNNVLYVFYQGVGVSWCYNTCSDGSTWGGQVQPSIGGGEASPSAVVYNNQLYLFYQGGDDWGVYYNIFDGSSWTPDAPIPDYPVISASPSAAVYAGELYVFYQTSANSGGLDYSVLNGSTWSSTLEVMPTGSMSGSPAAVLLNNYALWVLYEGPGNNGELCYVAYNGQLSWSTQHQVVPAVSSTYYSGQNAILSWCPNLLVSDNLLYVFMPASKEADVPYYLWSADGSSWSTLYKVPGTGIWDSPSTVVFNNTIYLFHTGTSGTSSGTDSQLWCNSAPCNPAGPLTWSGDKQLVNGATGQAMGLMANQSPSAVVFNNNIYCFFASPNNTLSYVIFNGSSYSPNVNYIIPSSGSNEIASSSPAAIAYNNQLYVFFQGVGSNSQPNGQLLYVTSSNGSSWSGVQQAGYLQAATGLSVWNILSTQVQSLIPPVMTNLKGQGPVDDKDIFGPNLFPAP